MPNELKLILCAKCNDHIVAGEQGAICEVCASTQESAITELQKENAELKKQNAANKAVQRFNAKADIEILHDCNASHELIEKLHTQIVELEKQNTELRKAAVEWEEIHSLSEIDADRLYLLDNVNGKWFVAYLPAPPREVEK